MRLEDIYPLRATVHVLDTPSRPRGSDERVRADRGHAVQAATEEDEEIMNTCRRTMTRLGTLALSALLLSSARHQPLLAQERP